jgi:hypothetical protein
MDPARIFTESLTPRPELENSQGQSRPGGTQRQVQPCPLFADRYRNGEPLKPTRRATLRPMHLETENAATIQIAKKHGLMS